MRIALAFFLLFAPGVLWAQSGSVRSEVDANKIGVDDVVTLSIVMEGDAASLDVAMPGLRNLRVVAGPSTSTQISFVNGSMSRQKSITFVLRAEKTGTAEVGPVAVQGHPPTAPITIEVVPGAIRPAQPQDPFAGDPFGGRDPFEEIFGRPQRRQPVNQGKLFVEATLSRPAARVGEPILVTYYVYTQISLTGVEFAAPPKYPGFWAEEVDRARGDSTGENTSVQGEAYLRYPVLERLLFPTKPGLLEIPEARLRLVPAGGPFGIAAPIERSTRALKVKVDSLPKGTPEDAAVGSYQVEAATDRTSVVLGDALTFRFKVTGRGNLKWVDAAPDLVISGARVFPPRVTSDLRTTRQGIEGSKTWEFVIVPEQAGAYEIPSISFPYFDPQVQTMRTERTQAIAIEVTAATSSTSDAPRKAAGPVSLRADLDDPQTDLAPVAGLLALLSVGAQVYIWRRRPQVAKGSHLDSATVSAAVRELRDDTLLNATKERAAARIAGALETVFGPRPGWPMDDAGDRLRSLADDLEFLRFAPQLGSYDAKLREVRDRALAILEAVH
ncbi:MAG: protein BatD [Vicinamibacteria bacterium]|nr:protein BatD [Vicinamibacteria bacterium]MBP9945318.1 protein BatD [Vicinamibacteria bacterium]